MRRKKKQRIWTDRKERRDEELLECEEEDEETTAEGVTKVQNPKKSVLLMKNTTYVKIKHKIIVGWLRDRHSPEGLWVHVREAWVVAELQFGKFWKVLKSCSLHHQQVLHVVQTEAKHNTAFTTTCNQHKLQVAAF